MNKGQRAIVAMLAAVAVLLVVNIMQGPRAAEAGKATDVIDEILAAFDAPKLGDGEPYVVTYLPNGTASFLRVWSDAQIDMWVKPNGPNCDFEFDVVYSLPLDRDSPVVPNPRTCPELIRRSECSRRRNTWPP